MVWLLNWVWQGTLLTAAVTVGLSCTRRLNAATRERIWWITLVGILLLPLLNLIGPSATAVVGDSLLQPLQTASVLVELPEALPIWWALVWAVCALWSLGGIVRLVISIRELRRTRVSVVPFPKPLERRLARWTAVSETERHIRARLVLSDRIGHAAVLGLGRPLIAIAPAAIVQLTPDELDQVVIHEYAHVRRRDDLATLAQRCICAIVAWHPAVWWVDRALTLEREVACDDWVLAHATAPKVYGACLLKLAEQPGHTSWHLAPGAGQSRSQLARRVRRLLDTGRNVSVRRSRLVLGTAGATVAVVVVIAGHLQIVRISGVSPLQSIALMTGFIDLPTGAARSITAVPQPATRAPVRPSVMPTMTLSPSGTGSDLASVFAFQPPTRVDLIRAVTVPMAVVSPDTLGRIEAPVANPPATPPTAARSPWLRMADAGVAIGDGARTAGVKTGGFFVRVGRSIGSGF